jgi:hypothetical protein
MDRPQAANRRPDVAFFAINLAIVLGAALFLAAQDGAYRSRIRAETLRDSKFLTTEWRLMRELKERTDRELRDKDREIAELRLRYRSFKDAGSSAELLASIEKEMRRAEAEREAILAARLKAVADPPAVPANAPSAPPPGESTQPPRASLAALGIAGAPETAVSEILRRRIAGLEAALATSRAGESAIERELEELRRGGSQPAAIQAAAAPAPPAGQPAAAAGGGEAEALAAAILDSLARQRDALADPDSVLGLSDLKTRALLRAIVRTPAIRAEYPDLLEALDRYLSLSGRAEYLRGKREAYGELVATVEKLMGGEAK